MFYTLGQNKHLEKFRLVDSGNNSGNSGMTINRLQRLQMTLQPIAVRLTKDKKLAFVLSEHDKDSESKGHVMHIINPELMQILSTFDLDGEQCNDFGISDDGKIMISTHK